MTKRSFLFILLSFVMVVGFSGKPINSQSANKEIIAGNLGQIELEGNQTTGYKWHYEIEDESNIQVVSDKYDVYEHEEGQLGVGGVHTWNLKGLQAGTTTIKFEYYRDSTPDKVKKIKEYQVTVKPQQKEVIKDNFIQVKLEGNQTTGYKWHCNIEDEDIAQVTADNYEVEEPDSGKAGAGGIHTWNIKGLKPGITIVKFEYYRDSTPEKVAKTREYILKVID